MKVFDQETKQYVEATGTIILRVVKSIRQIYIWDNEYRRTAYPVGKRRVK